MDTIIGFPSALYTATRTGSFIIVILNFTYQQLGSKMYVALVTGVSESEWVQVAYVKMKTACFRIQY